MRARAGLAQCLWTMGEREAAVEHYRGMLRLNPNDNQGTRDVLMSGLLEMGRDEEAQRLLAQYDDDASAVWSYSGAPLAFRRLGDGADSRKRLRGAIDFNAHVPAYLLRRKRLPRRAPDLIGFGDEDEAISYAFDNLDIWKATPGALALLQKYCSSAKLPE